MKSLAKLHPVMLAGTGSDVANYIPARLTALLMIAPLLFPRLGGRLWAQKPLPQSGKVGRGLLRFVCHYGRNHASPNSGYPEAALAGILDCRFGDPHYYFGELFDKPYIGENDRPLTTADMKKAVRVNTFILKKGEKASLIIEFL